MGVGPQTATLAAEGARSSCGGCGAGGGGVARGLFSRDSAPQQQETRWQRLNLMAAKTAPISVVAPPRIARMSAVDVTMLPIRSKSYIPPEKKLYVVDGGPPRFSRPQDEQGAEAERCPHNGRL